MSDEPQSAKGAKVLYKFVETPKFAKEEKFEDCGVRTTSVSKLPCFFACQFFS